MAALQPMNPITVRSIELSRLHSRMISKSTPGAANPVQEVTIRWVIFSFPVDKPIDRLRRQAWRFLVVFSHSRSGRGKIAGDIKSVIVERFIEAGLGWTERRPATSYVRSGSHSLKEKPRAPVLYHAVGKTHERCMDVVVGSGDAEAV